MNIKLITFGLLAALTLQASCTSSTQESETKVEETNPLPLGDNTETSVDWNGTYKGTVPCASCEGIEVTLTLNMDRTYKIVTNYLGRNDALEQENTGSFTWNESGSIITLEEVAQGPNQYKVGEGRIWQLDMNGEVIQGDLADHYILTKR
ncbi:copper resistance protein NlpE [Algoriphagus halophytocola]|uniref:copper resistance protein NlpE n=1 Tax=Algoriphagus halophytocola TaxID=2991499 RepID=UPI0022DD383B|nr:copper resistance protein NlpE [Algoriphagus sp. TR-M9]WBL42737.1 copper resistance protein NlpE [Algoriphagus sp. TR-M9]